jgi:hypothetical protein
LEREIGALKSMATTRKTETRQLQAAVDEKTALLSAAEDAAKEVRLAANYLFFVGLFAPLIGLPCCDLRVKRG